MGSVVGDHHLPGGERDPEQGLEVTKLEASVLELLVDAARPVVPGDVRDRVGDEVRAVLLVVLDAPDEPVLAAGKLDDALEGLVPPVPADSLLDVALLEVGEHLHHQAQAVALQLGLSLTGDVAGGCQVQPGIRVAAGVPVEDFPSAVGRREPYFEGRGVSFGEGFELFGGHANIVRVDEVHQWLGEHLLAGPAHRPLPVVVDPQQLLVGAHAGHVRRLVEEGARQPLHVNPDRSRGAEFGRVPHYRLLPGRCWAPEQEPLAEADPGVDEPVAQPLVLDSFGDDVDPEVLGHSGQGLDDHEGTAGIGAVDIGDQVPVELQEVERQLP